MSDESQAAMKKAAEEGGAHMAAQAKHVAEVAEAEAARRANLPEGDTTLPEGVFATEDEAVAYVNQARAEGKTVNLIYDDNPDEGAYVWEISSPYPGYETVWTTSVS
jgi:hypothetical protein